MSTTEIAETVCDNQITPETVRIRLHDFDILSEKSQKILEEMNPEDLDQVFEEMGFEDLELTSVHNDVNSKYRLRAPDSSDSGGALA